MSRTPDEQHFIIDEARIADEARYDGLYVLRSGSLAVAAIGHGLAAARGLLTKHAIKQVDRLLSNPGIKIDDILTLWVPYVVGARTSIAMDWTDFDADNQATLMLSLITEHGRATPLLWLTVDKKTLKDQRNLYEDSEFDTYFYFIVSIQSSRQEKIVVGTTFRGFQWAASS